MMNIVKEERKSPCMINCGPSNFVVAKDTSSASNIAQYYDEATSTSSISLLDNNKSSSYRRIQDTNTQTLHQNKNQNLNYKDNISISISTNSLSSSIPKCAPVNSATPETVNNSTVESEYFSSTCQFPRNNLPVELQSISKKDIAVYSSDINSLGSRGITKNDIGKELSTIYPGDISEAVSKILDDYDWSQIPLTNSDRKKLHVKRPMNAFMVWAQEARRKLSGQHRQVHNAELSKSLGRIWRGMSDAQKKPFIDRAEQLRKKHKQEYPDYKYQPRRKKENVKSVSGEKMSPFIGPKLPPTQSLISGDSLSSSIAYSCFKGSHVNIGSHPLSPPNSPAVAPLSRNNELNVEESQFAGECLTDNFDGIDRAEMNRYLLPDQSGMFMYHPNPYSMALNSVTTNPPEYTPDTQNINACINETSTSSENCSTTMSSIVNNIVISSTGQSPGSYCYVPTSSFHPVNNSRLIPPSGHYTSASQCFLPSSPVNEIVKTKPEIDASSNVVGSSTSPGQSDNYSPDSGGDYVELQPRRSMKGDLLYDDMKHSNLLTVPQPCSYYNYPYSYPVWHG